MKILSEKTGMTYSTVDECIAAEKEYDDALKAEQKRKEELASSRKTRALEVENAYKAIGEANKTVAEARKNYYQLLHDFIKDYGSFHMTLNAVDEDFIDEINKTLDFLF